MVRTVSIFDATLEMVNMILLQSMNRYRKIALFDPSTNRLSWRRRQPGFDPSLQDIQGTVGRLPFHTICLFRLNNELHLWIDGNDFVVDDDVTVELETLPFHRRRLILLKGGKRLYTLSYFRPINFIPLAIDPTPGVEEEHLDVGLMVYNILNDPERRRIAKTPKDSKGRCVE